ncbi:N-acylneuraminate cytidylyltransferase domain protein [Anopheles sinensis]|uniref:N-acylneuraminate cytidylyltransferase domain protein n=1 Tax=Anopheles sinensis TaxID=74873 RepID=A0A084VUS8_ANOSI|nr:N-acylneuraminate cytidylyltransferase domain protein [Anopheles sinensis]
MHHPLVIDLSFRGSEILENPGKVDGRTDALFAISERVPQSRGFILLGPVGRCSGLVRSLSETIGRTGDLILSSPNHRVSVLRASIKSRREGLNSLVIDFVASRKVKGSVDGKRRSVPGRDKGKKENLEPSSSLTSRPPCSVLRDGFFPEKPKPDEVDGNE